MKKTLMGLFIIGALSLVASVVTGIIYAIYWLDKHAPDWTFWAAIAIVILFISYIVGDQID